MLLVAAVGLVSAAYGYGLVRLPAVRFLVLQILGYLVLIASAGVVVWHGASAGTFDTKAVVAGVIGMFAGMAYGTSRRDPPPDLDDDYPVR